MSALCASAVAWLRATAPSSLLAPAPSGALGRRDGGDDVLELGLERRAAHEEAVDVGARREVGR
eukprot:CAMPEP_0206162280 /NCGR_PEP_ID=MMETSP1474-20131121/9376_1 /ASSEMBLY_ACC=CAM_ASM_001110 /TAXON_ID=97495 /ORGANISM="Imantonia sp., Strain RCC918" /LENGTH=63 /DNA_ID=CAMNT_0053564475 /DNA_START=73 /DNA_END=260 /DNA_ORIENTATION=-